MYTQDFYTQQGDWLHMFAKPLPATVSAEVIEKTNKEFSAVNVKEWVNKHDSIQRRFRFF